MLHVKIDALGILFCTVKYYSEWVLSAAGAVEANINSVQLSWICTQKDEIRRTKERLT